MKARYTPRAGSDVAVPFHAVSQRFGDVTAVDTDERFEFRLDLIIGGPHGEGGGVIRP
ncbi:MAG: hypothetical protein M3O70_07130 [Actinomycetota bacterium]|nr:hypothetical protein [Actinomycetota bacterium]